MNIHKHLAILVLVLFSFCIPISSLKAQTPNDTTRPEITAFAIPTTATTLKIPITSIGATDNVGVTGYKLTETEVAPLPGAAGWSTIKPTSYTFATAGEKILFPWAKDAAGNVSLGGHFGRVTVRLVADAEAPVVTGFSVPTTVTSLIVPITSLVATDNVGVTGYKVTETATPPLANVDGWITSRLTSYKVTSAGYKILYAWAKDAAGNVSAFAVTRTTVTLPTNDTTRPEITAFSIPTTATTLRIPITSIGATDNVGVTGYKLTETEVAPLPGAAGWTTTKPTSYTFATAGEKILFPWAKDAAGNVSLGGHFGRVTVRLAVTDTSEPVLVDFVIPATATTLRIPVSRFTAVDDTGVTGYKITETATVPLASATGWTTTAPTTYTVSSAGAKTLYAWVKDAAGNVSINPIAKRVVITLPVNDTSAPIVARFDVPSRVETQVVPITTFVVTDDTQNVTGILYKITETATTPSDGEAGWSTTKPTRYVLTSVTAGEKTLYAWAKDAAGNISRSLSDTTFVVRNTVDTTAPVVARFDVPSTVTSLAIPITAFEVLDARTDIQTDTSRIYYKITETGATPSESARGWTTTKPTTYTVSSAGAKTLYAWAKDGSDNVSRSLSDTVSVVLADGSNPTAPITYTFTRDLSYGSSGDDVRVLQEMLIARGFLAPGSDSGAFYAKTREALIVFQRANDISPATGYFGPLTRSRLGESNVSRPTESESDISIGDLVRLLVSLGIIPQDKAEQALSVVSELE